MKERTLSLRQAFNCEMGRGGRCRCRCAGRSHGLARINNPPAEWSTDPAIVAHINRELSLLPVSDRHHVAMPEPSSKPPMRLVTQARYHRTSLRSRRGHWVLTLECGHVVKRKLSTDKPAQVHCSACLETRPLCKRCKEPLADHPEKSCLKIPGRGGRR